MACGAWSWMPCGYATGVSTAIGCIAMDCDVTALGLRMMGNFAVFVSLRNQCSEENLFMRMFSID